MLPGAVPPTTVITYSGSGAQFCTTTQQTPAAGAGAGPRLHWLVGG